MFVFKGNHPTTNELVSYTISVPKAVITTEKCFFASGAALNNSNCTLAQLALTTTAMTDTILRFNNSSYNNVVITTYYR